MSTAQSFENLNIAPDQIIPTVDTRVFDGSRASFFVGVLASKNVVHHPSEYLASLKLRANVYIDEFGFLPVDSRQSDGTERDKDDDRSNHYGVVEYNSGQPRLIGTMRAIVKRFPEDHLPAEKIFPEVFESGGAPVGSLEASRFIARHPDRSIQSATSISLIRTIVAQSIADDLKPVYAIVEEPFYKLLNRIKLPLERLADPKVTPEYNNTENMLLKFMPAEIMEEVVRHPEQRRLLANYFHSIPEHNGVGLFDSKLVGTIKPEN